MSTWNRIDALRRKHNLNAKQIAHIAGVVPSAIANWKAGSSIRSDALHRLAVHFNVSIDALIGINPDDQIHPGQAAPAFPPATLALAPPATPPACRFPADCDLDQRMSAIEIKLDTLLGLLGAPILREIEARKRKVG